MNKKPTQAEIAIAIIKQYIQVNQDVQNNKLQLIFDKIPFDKITKFNANLILCDFLSLAHKAKNKFAIPIIFHAWGRAFSEIDEMSISSLLFVIPSIPIDAFTFAIRSFEDITFDEVLLDLMSYEDSPDIIPACDRIITVLGEQKFEKYQQFFDEAKENGNIHIQQFLIRKMEDVSPYLEKPTYVKNYSNLTLSLEKDLQNPILNAELELPSNEEMIQLLGSDNNEIDEQDAQKTLRAFLEIATKEEKLKIYEPILILQTCEKLQIKRVKNIDKIKKILSKDPLQKVFQEEMQYYADLQRLHGPIHPAPGDDSLLDYTMFLCNIYDYDEEENCIQPWFTGACEHCHKRIRYYWHSVREPKVGGGWAGCYCSFDCVRKDISDENEDADIIESLTNTMELKIKQYGIQDRLANL
jgi:hypothetical protein